jgi:putative ATP-dependent endonuclease of OLD family
VVVLRSGGEGARAYSLAKLALADVELEDLQRYINTTRADLLFSRGVIFVEGDAEEALLPVFAASLGHDLDERGVAVCNVAGVNFTPYVKLAATLGMPYAVITDWDPLDGAKPPLGKERALALQAARRLAQGKPPTPPDFIDKIRGLEDQKFREQLGRVGVFLNASTLELAVAESAALRDPLLTVLEEENFGPIRSARIAAWKTGKVVVDGEQMLAMISEIGKGRLAGRLAAKATGLAPPDYIRAAVEHVIKDV